MKKETYEKIFKVIGTNNENTGLWSLIGAIITACTCICYAATIADRIILSQWRELEVLVLVPALSFVAVSIFRRVYNAKRPYEVYGFRPLIFKNTKGKSFPSRHVFSIFVIAVTVGYFYPSACAALVMAGVLLGVIRVITGVHFPRDVIAGGIVGIFFGIVADILLFLL